ncbi:Os11g0660400, partial [Oryza sativa Japonica Group]
IPPPSAAPPLLVLSRPLAAVRIPLASSPPHRPAAIDVLLLRSPHHHRAARPSVPRKIAAPPLHRCASPTSPRRRPPSSPPPIALHLASIAATPSLFQVAAPVDSLAIPNPNPRRPCRSGSPHLSSSSQC